MNEDILKEFKKAFEVARNYIFDHISSGPGLTGGSRSGDTVSSLDNEVYQIYNSLAERYKILVIGEENTGSFDDGISRERFYEHEYLMILDSIDATVNMLSNLPFGVNFAFGRIRRGMESFRINDLERVAVVDYISRKSFEFSADKGMPVVNSPYYDGKPFGRSPGANPLLFEVPDEFSYVDDEAIRLRQLRLIEIYRKIFPGIQRRAIDCTGLRMLEVYDRNLAAYGDLREAAMIWDTVPSIRYLLESNEIVILNGKLEQITGEEEILVDKNGQLFINNALGKSVIVLPKNKQAEFLDFKDYIING